MRSRQAWVSTCSGNFGRISHTSSTCPSTTVGNGRRQRLAVLLNDREHRSVTRIGQVNRPGYPKGRTDQTLLEAGWRSLSSLDHSNYAAWAPRRALAARRCGREGLRRICRDSGQKLPFRRTHAHCTRRHIPLLTAVLEGLAPLASVTE